MQWRIQKQNKWGGRDGIDWNCLELGGMGRGRVTARSIGRGWAIVLGENLPPPPEVSAFLISNDKR